MGLYHLPEKYIYIVYHSSWNFVENLSEMRGNFTDVAGNQVGSAEKICEVFCEKKNTPKFLKCFQSFTSSKPLKNPLVNKKIETLNSTAHCPITFQYFLKKKCFEKIL